MTEKEQPTMSDSGRDNDPYRKDLARCARDWATAKHWDVPAPLRERLLQIADALSPQEWQPISTVPDGTNWKDVTDFGAACDKAGRAIVEFGKAAQTLVDSIVMGLSMEQRTQYERLLRQGWQPLDAALEAKRPVSR